MNYFLISCMILLSLLILIPSPQKPQGPAQPGNGDKTEKFARGYPLVFKAVQFIARSRILLECVRFFGSILARVFDQWRNLDNFLVRHKIIRPARTDGLGSSLWVCWSEYHSEGNIFSLYHSKTSYYYRYERGFGGAATNKADLAKALLERIKNQRTNRGPGNVYKDIRPFEQGCNTFYVYLDEKEKTIKFERFFSSGPTRENRGVARVYLAKEEEKECLDAIERILREPPDEEDIVFRWGK